MEQKEFIEVFIGSQTIMISISSIAFVRPSENGANCVIVMKEQSTGTGAYYIESTSGYHTVKSLIKDYCKV